MSDTFEFKQANGPLLISFPHDGTQLPPKIESRCTKVAKQTPDTDWFISELYNFITEMDVSYIKPYYSRYVVDLNRSARGGSLYPGQFETSVCPVTTFDGYPIYLPGEEPGRDEIETRMNTYWKPYHNHIKNELARIKALHGRVILWDAHSIRGEVAQLFDGVLPDLNFGTANGTSCENQLIAELVNLAKESSDYSVILDGRFKGGYITRHYGKPKHNINAIQLEINQSNYLKPDFQFFAQSTQTSSTPIDAKRISHVAGIDHHKALQLSRLLERLIHCLLKL